MPQLTSASSAAATSMSNSSSASFDASLSRAAPANSTELAVPGSQVPLEVQDAGSRRTSYRDQQQLPGGAPTVPAAPRFTPSHHRAAVPIPVTPSSVTRTRSSSSSSSSGSSSSGSPMRFQRLQRHTSTAGGFLSATASQLLGALSGITLVSSSPTGSVNSSSFTGRRTHHRVRASAVASRHSLRGSLLVRAPALLDLDPSESYDDLLALDQFNVKRAVRPAVLAALPHRTPDAQDQQQQRRCFICLEPWHKQVQQQDVESRDEGSTAAAAACAGCRRCVCCEVKGAAAHQGSTVGSVHAATRTAGDSAAGVMGQQQQLDGGAVGLQACSEATANSPFAVAAAATEVVDAVQWPFSSSCSCHRCGVSQHVATIAPVVIGTGSSSGRSISQLQQERQQHNVLVNQLPCGHEFCVGCICSWLKEHATCPVCRWTFPEELTELINMDN